MTILVSDSSVLIDLERGVLLQACFALPELFAVPDRLYQWELAPYNGPQLLAMGLQVMTLDATGVTLVQGYVHGHRRISVSDAFALALAKTGV